MAQSLVQQLVQLTSRSFKVKAIALGTAGLPGFISINPAHAGWLHYFIGMLVAFIVSVAITLILSRRKAYQASAE